MGVRSGPRIPTRGPEFNVLGAAGEFDSTTGWAATNTLGSSNSWGISGGVASINGTQSSTTHLYRSSSPFIENSYYKITLTITAYTAGTLNISFHTGSAASGTNMTAVGTYSFVGQCTGNNAIYIAADASFNGSIDNYSAVKVESDGSYISPLILCLDAFNIKSYAGEVGTDVNLNTPVAGVHDYTGTTYASSNEWASDATKLTKTYDATIRTPLDDGYGATIISESGNAGYHHLSHMGGSGSGNHMISFYFKPITNDITDFRAGMLGDGSNGGCIFNFVAGTVTAVGGSSGKVIVFEKLSNGWWFCACDINGRVGGWVGSIGPSMHTSYTGTAGNKKGYICGLQYSNKSYPTAYGDRSATDGWRDISGNGNHGTITNTPGTRATHFGNFNIMLPIENAYLDFDGTGDYVDFGSAIMGEVNSAATFCAWVSPSTTSGNPQDGIIGEYVNGFIFSTSVSAYGDIKLYDGTTNHISSGGFVLGNVWNHCVITWQASGRCRIYHNGQEVHNAAVSATSFGNSPTNTRIGSIGGDYGSSSYMMNGKIATVQLYKAKLTAVQVKDMYNSQKSRFGL